MKLKLILPILIIGLIFVSGCIQTESGTGTLVMQITDKPADFEIEKAIVTISNIKVHKADYNEGDNESNESEAGWYTVVEESQTFDLIEIKDVKEFLGSTELESGKYTQIRLDVESALATINGTDHDLTIPSRTIKLTKSFTINTNETTTLTIDFDANESIHATGNGKYIMKPTIKVIQE
ncbi:MAG: DUF4382 domain-containing protein [Candidatus Woesearchaeota archaeon]|nr:MAG: DUF4382 domain-containing protein [Candidatus Woesearchaeota archaeon]